MLVKNLKECKEIIAGDKTILREILHPDNDGIDISYSLAHAKVKPGDTSLPHRLKTSSEIYYVLKGQGIVYIDEESKEVEGGNVVYIPPNAVQYIKNIGNEELEFLCIVSPPWHKKDEEVIK